ncbi:MAG: four helix bundle protein [Parcubacteria group bacterium]|nr:four helix bundle protein [Parcubacteria group bacterium]
MQSHKDLIVWQRAMELVKEVYLVTEHFPKSEIFGLSSQMRRAAVAIPSNTAEGFSRKFKKEFRHFLCIAFGSGAELETQLILSKDLGFIRAGSSDKMELFLEEVRKMLNKMITTLGETKP